VPLRHEGAIIGVLDIDSCDVGTFDSIDQEWLERIVALVTR
jgi:GAF domain-containing protein